MRKRPNDVEKLDQISQSINSDGKGNLTVNKDLGVDGKLKLKSLVSASNPDGDITKELGGGGGGGTRHVYSVLMGSSASNPDTMHYEVYTDKNYDFPIGSKINAGFDFMTNDNYKELRSIGFHPVSGIWIANKNLIANLLEIQETSVKLSGFVLNSSTYDTYEIGMTHPFSIVKLA